MTSPEGPQRVEIQSGEEQEALLQQELAQLTDFEQARLQSFLSKKEEKLCMSQLKNSESYGKLSKTNQIIIVTDMR